MSIKMSDHLRRLFAYDDWANREVLASFQRAGTPPDQARKRLAHILGAEYLWYSRITHEPCPLAVWPDLNVAECGEYVARMAEIWRNYLPSLEEQQLGAMVKYKNTKGEPWTNTLQDILLHVAIHGAYHRGQIASDMRTAGYTPAYTDFIHGVRQGLLE